MNVWKKQTVRYLKDGKQCRKGTKGAKPKTVESKRWYGTLRLRSGQRKQIPLTEGKETSQKLLQKLQRDEDVKRSLGIDEIDEKRSQNIMKAVEAYVEHLRNKGSGDDHVRMTLNRLRKLFKASKTTTIGNLDSGRILKTLADWRKNGLSINTSNHYLRSAKSFSRWLLKERFLKHDPLFGLSKQNAETDRRRVRRPFTDDELKRLLRDTQQSPKRYLGSDWQFLPADRSTLYLLAANTGLRAKELSSLTIDDFDFGSKTLTVQASNTKNKKKAVLPLTDNVISTLLKWFPTRGGIAKSPTSRHLFPGRWNNQRMAGKMLQRDLKRSGIASTDGNGKTLDFHSLRYTFISNLAKANVHPSKAQRLARHSDINLTMSVYTQLEVDDLRDAVDGLPVF